MTIILYLAALIIALGLFSFLMLFLVFMIDSVVKSHTLPTSRRATKSIMKIVSGHKSAKGFYDLGCAHGTLAVRIKREFPSLSVHAIDNNPIRVFFAKMRSMVYRVDVDFQQKNIFDVSLSDADIVYIYLWYDLLPPLEKKLQKELKPGAIVIANTSNFPTWKPIQKIITYPKTPNMPDFETLFVYQKS